MSEVNDTTLVEYRVSEEFPNYRAGTDGTVWKRRDCSRNPNQDPEWILVTPLLTKGYHAFTIYKDGKSVFKRVHRFVLETFIGKPSGKKDACHLDHNRTNNSLKNLRWGTRQENMDQMVQADRQARGERNRHAKLNDETVIEIQRLYLQGVPEPVLAKQFNVSGGTVGRIGRGDTWRHITVNVTTSPEIAEAITSHHRNSRRNAANGAKLNPEKVSEIRRLYRNGCSGPRLAELFGIRSQNIYAIINGTSWKDVI